LPSTLRGQSTPAVPRSDCDDDANVSELEPRFDQQARNRRHSPNA
jgi:hypothetical protein